MNWRTVQLGALADVVMGQSPPGSTYNQEAVGLPFFQGKAEFGDQFPTVKKWCSAPSRVAYEGDILLSVRAPVGPTNLAPGDCCIGRGLAAIRAKPSVLSQGFLWFFLKYVEPVLAESGQGSTFGAVNRSDIETLRIPVPPLSEQRRIAEILDQADALRRKRAEADAKAARILPALFYKMFGDPATNPMGWPVHRLGDLCRVIRGASPRPKGDPRFFGGRIPWIMISDVTRDPGKYLEYTRETLTDEGRKRSVFLERNTLILTNSATVGVPKILGIPGCIHDGFLAFLDLDDSLDQDYLFHFFALIRSRLGAIAPSGTQKNLNTGIAKSITLPLPLLELQRRFAERAESLHSLQSKQSGCADRIAQLNEMLLNRAFSGELTAKWREARMKELLEEMEIQARTLLQDG